MPVIFHRLWRVTGKAIAWCLWDHRGLPFGYENVKERYENIRTKALMGRLQFTAKDVQQHSPTVIQMLGKFELERK